MEKKSSEMSWSVSASGTPDEVQISLNEQLKNPLAEAPNGLQEETEKQTVRLVQAAINQCLSTFGEDRKVTVIASASGHMGFADWEHRGGCYQAVELSIRTA